MAESTGPRCVSCNSDSVRVLGVIPDGHSFAGIELKTAMSGGELVRCNSCHLVFRFPMPKSETLEALYAAAPEINWHMAGNDVRRDWQFILRTVTPLGTGQRVLDVGCFEGGLLEKLPRDWLKFGIEINPGAAKIAESRGVKIIGHELFRTLAGYDSKFDVVIAANVSEHIADPGALLHALRRVVTDTGLVLLSTGNSDAFLWRLVKGRYWYCANPEHVSFINVDWGRTNARKYGFTFEEGPAFSFADRSLKLVAKELLANAAYFWAPSVLQMIRASAGVSAPVTYPPAWLTARDHKLFLFKAI